MTKHTTSLLRIGVRFSAYLRAFHIRQFERWGPFLIPEYWLVSFVLRLRGYDPYLDNPFEPPPPHSAPVR